MIKFRTNSKYKNKIILSMKAGFARKGLENAKLALFFYPKRLYFEDYH